MRTTQILALAFTLLSGNAAFADDLRNGLPPTRMDSFVREAGENAEMIYGDEGLALTSERDAKGKLVPPTPYLGFTAKHRINAGIMGVRSDGLTTGHGSYLPDAWGRDEFLPAGQEYSLSATPTPQDSDGPLMITGSTAPAPGPLTIMGSIAPTPDSSSSSLTGISIAPLTLNGSSGF